MDGDEDDGAFDDGDEDEGALGDVEPGPAWRPGAGRVVLAGTPIGNPGDASSRLRDALATADVVAAEDTRRLQRLCAALGVRTTGRVVSLHEHNERARSADLVAQAAAGATVLVVTDAGMPTVSDPGYRIVTTAVAAGVVVTTLPGPSAVLAALAVSGLPTDRFCFEGFPPRRPGERDRAFAALGAEPRTLVFFESPRRTAATLTAMAAATAFGPQRPAALCRELTKTFEEVRRGPLAELAAHATEVEVLGEVVLVVGGAPAVAVTGTSPAELAAAVAAEIEAGTDYKAAVVVVAGRTGLPRRTVYDAVVAARHGQLT